MRKESEKGIVPATGTPADAETLRENERRYLCDDRERDALELAIFPGGNGDWYVGTVEPGTAGIGCFVRLCTSGGASSARPGLTVAIAQAWRALATEPGSAGDALPTSIRGLDPDFVTERDALTRCREALDSQEFYELMQAYRMAPVTNPGWVVEKYEAVQAFIRATLSGATPAHGSSMASASPRADAGFAGVPESQQGFAGRRAEDQPR